VLDLLRTELVQLKAGSRNGGLKGTSAPKKTKHSSHIPRREGRSSSRQMQTSESNDVEGSCMSEDKTI